MEQGCRGRPVCLPGGVGARVRRGNAPVLAPGTMEAKIGRLGEEPISTNLNQSLAVSTNLVPSSGLNLSLNLNLFDDWGSHEQFQGANRLGGSTLFADDAAEVFLGDAQFKH